MAAKYCKDCTHNMKDSELSPFCRKSKAIDLVTGKEEYRRCREMRKARATCGLSGKLFENEK
jgi:hypothetical protein